METISKAIPIVIDMVTTAFTAMTSNPLLAVYFAAGLVVVGIGLFSALRGAAHV